MEQKALPLEKDIDAISGAIISVYRITLDVQDKTALPQELIRIGAV